MSLFADPPPQPGFCGWTRANARDRWLKTCSAPTWEDCWSLLDSVKRPGGDRWVGAEGVDPNEGLIRCRCLKAG